MEMYQKGEYEPQSLSYAVNLAAEVAEIFISKGIDILRISLQTTDGVNSKSVIGPYHEAFAELVYSEIEKRKLEKHIIENNLSNCTLEIKTDKPSQLIGHRKSNKEYFKEKYNVIIKPL